MIALKIGNKEYKIEFAFEASLHEECTAKLYRVITGLFNDKDKDRALLIAEVPHTSLTMFYAGLLEHHRDEVKSEADAKELLRQYFVEHKNENFYSFMEFLVGQVNEDNFLELVGFNPLEEKPVEAPKKRKTTNAKIVTPGA